jgi:hypothetical protein
MNSLFFERSIMFVRILSLTGLVLFAAVPFCQAQTNEVIPLPRITFGTVVNVGGKVVENKDETYLGVLGLPFDSNPLSREVVPPLGFQETTNKDSILIQGKKVDVKRIDWTRRPGVSANVRAGKITLWVSDQIKTPEFEIPIPNGTGVPLLAGTVKFEVQPSVDKEFPNDATAAGMLLEVKMVSLGTRKIQAYRFQMETKSADFGLKGEIWISGEVPGKLYKIEGEVTGKKTAKVSQEMKKIEDEPIPTGMTLVEKSGFAIVAPKGWEIAAPKMKAKDEVLRFVPSVADAKLDRAITIEVRAASGKDVTKWGNELAGERGEEYRASFYLKKGMGDNPTFTVSRWKGSAARVATLKIGTVCAEQLFIISHWQNGIAERTHAGEDEVQQVADSWRWLRRKTTP